MPVQIKNKWLYIILFLFLFLGNTYAQKKSIRFRHYTMEEGLPQNLVDCILQDSEGFMWFGTWGGLVRFDGYTFKIYRQQLTEYSTISNN
jgi:ligand-binding sensor domain-containing protein